MTNIRLVSWNINGFRAAINKGLWAKMADIKADIYCFQEIKANPSQIPASLDRPRMFEYWNPAARAGYSGVATFSQLEPRATIVGDRDNDWDDEGRVIVSKFDHFTLLNVYFPNGKRDSGRLQYKLDFYDYFLTYINRLREQGEKVIFCGDVNTAHTDIDLSNPRQNQNISGFLPVERRWLDKLADNHWVDTYRHFYPDKIQYTWWSQISAARSRNVGWRIDYFYIDQALLPHLKSADILDQIMGSDHCPIDIVLRF